MSTEIRVDQITARNLMQAEPPTYAGDSNLQSLAIEMVRKRTGGLSIVDEKKRLIGIVTEFDLMRAIRKGRNLKKVSAKEVMSKDPITISAEAAAPEIFDRLEQAHIVHLPVVDRDKKLVGMIERYDALSLMTLWTIVQ